MKYLDHVLQEWRIKKALAFIKPGDSVLDIGCADGAFFRFATQIGESVGIDPDFDENDRRTLPPLPRVRFYKGLFPDALPDRSLFDAITMLAVLEHVPADKLDALARDCASFLKPGGRLVITVPSPTVDHVLAVLRWFRVIDGMSLEQHYGFESASTPEIFRREFDLLKQERFQLGLNNLFVFGRRRQ